MIKELLDKKDVAGIFDLLNNPSYYLAIHESLMVYTNLTEQWLIIKAFGLSNHRQKYMDFAVASIESQYGLKAIFHNILTNLYGESYRFHQAPKGVNQCYLTEEDNPKLLDYIKIANSILK